MNGILVSLGMILLAACGGRTVGVTYDGRPGDDGGRPDARADGGVTGCEVPSEPVIIENPGEPCFVYSLSRLGDGRYVLGGAKGWPGAGGIQAGLWFLGQDLQPQGTLAIPGEMALASYDAVSDEVGVVVEADNQVRFQRYGFDASGTVQLADAHLCNDCTPSWSSPLMSASHAAVAVRHFGESDLQVYILPREGGLVLGTPTASGSTPHLVEHPDGPALVYTQAGQLWAWPFRWNGDSYADPLVGFDEPIAGVLTTTGSLSEGTWAAVLGNDGEVPSFYLLTALGQGPALVHGQEAGVVSYVMEMDLSLGSDTVGVAWGVTFGQVGAHFMAFDRSQPELIFGPALISEPTSHQTSSYSIWAAAAPHPQGHAVAWGAWQESTLHGIYGKVIRCSADSASPAF